MLLFSLLINSCSNVRQTSKKNPFFEGTIVYSTKYQPYSPIFKEEELMELICSKIIMTLKNGNYKKQYISSNGNIISERYLDLESQKSYLKEIDNDTIYWFDITKSDTKTTFRLLNDTIISSFQLRGIETTSIVKLPNSNMPPVKLKGAFYYSKKYKVNPDWYKDYNEDNFNDIIKYGKGIQLFEFHKGLFWEQKIYAEKVLPEKVNEKEIQPPIDKNTILKEL